MTKQQVAIATVTLNPAFDLIGRIDTLELGQVNTIQSLGLFPAGKGINVAKVLSSCRHLSAQAHPLFNAASDASASASALAAQALAPVTVTGLLGGDNRAGFDADFVKTGVVNKFMSLPGSTRINVKVTTNDNVSDFNFSGFSVTPEQWEAFVAQSLVDLQGHDYIAVCGSLPAGVSLEAFTSWLKQLKATGATVFVDSSLNGLRAALQASVNFVKPNEHELGQLVGNKFDAKADFDAIVETAKQLQDAHAIEHLVISLGADGAVWLHQTASGRSVYRAQPQKVTNVVSTVGAGDSMVAGFLYALALGLAPQQVLQVASAFSSYAVTIETVGFASWTALEPYAQPTVSQLA